MITKLCPDIKIAGKIIDKITPVYVIMRIEKDVVEEAACCDTEEECNGVVADMRKRPGTINVAQQQNTRSVQ